MSDLDLTDAVEAAARAQHEAIRQLTASVTAPPTLGIAEWDHLPDIERHFALRAVLEPVQAAAPVIAAQVRERIAAAIEALAHRHGHTDTITAAVLADCAALARRGGNPE